MNQLLEAANEVCTFMAQREWQFCLIGGLAVQHWGEPRTTLDADFTLMTGWGEEERFVTALLDRFRSRISDAHAFAVDRRVLIIEASNKVPVDISLGALPFETEMVRRATPVEFAPGLKLPCCTPEDLFVMKVFAGRTRDWLDAQSVAVRQKQLNRTYILTHLTSLLELSGNSGDLDRARQLLEDGP
ncbi:MAG: nucleotidyl transferase AbiEii/AbiGii toxin family protein [Candidatus Hydrogenedentes bacterium]|nr:nucleotidyl transferase AbiEii/AbiGii toxin family protein [Candidatus Hydrogenedentota bacterium]